MLPNPDLYLMLLCHDYENVSIHILPEELVFCIFIFYVQILADVHVCFYVMFLYVLNCYCVLWYFVRNDEIELYNQSISDHLNTLNTRVIWYTLSYFLLPLSNKIDSSQRVCYSFFVVVVVLIMFWIVHISYYLNTRTKSYIGLGSQRCFHRWTIGLRVGLSILARQQSHIAGY